MSVTFRIKASEAQGRRLDPGYHHAVRRTRIISAYLSAKLLSLSYFRTGNWFSTDLYEREGNKILSRGILGRDVLSRSMFEAEPFFFGCQVNGKVFLQKMRKEV